MKRRLFVTTALPYANGSFHIGHIMEYIQADIWVRFQRMRGHEVHFVCADDGHGAPIMLKAQAEGITPEALIARIAAERPQYLNGFHISFDNWHSTHSPENTELSQDIYRALKANDLITTRVIEQFFDPVKEMFLPDRYIKGECPKCGAKDQYGDSCEACGAVYAPTDLRNPTSTLSGATPVMRQSEHFFFRLSDPRCVAFLRDWTQGGRLQPEVANKAREWLDGESGLGDWDISRDAPYFGIPIPDAPGKYFYVWLDAPIGYLASLKNHFAKGQAAPQTAQTYDAFVTDPGVEQYHFIGKDIIYFHTLFWPATLHFSGRKTPDNVFVHGFITVSGEKMSKSRGTGISPLRYLELGMNPEWLRYYIAAKLNARVEDIDFNPDDFVARVNSDLVGKYVNIASRAANFLVKHFDGQVLDPRTLPAWATLNAQAVSHDIAACIEDANMVKRSARPWSSPTASISISTPKSPGKWRATPRGARRSMLSVRCALPAFMRSPSGSNPCCQRSRLRPKPSWAAHRSPGLTSTALPRAFSATSTSWAGSIRNCSMHFLIHPTLPLQPPLLLRLPKPTRRSRAARHQPMLRSRARPAPGPPRPEPVRPATKGLTPGRFPSTSS